METLISSACSQCASGLSKLNKSAAREAERVGLIGCGRDFLLFILSPIGPDFSFHAMVPRPPRDLEGKNSRGEIFAP